MSLHLRKLKRLEIMFSITALSTKFDTRLYQLQ